MREYSIPEVYKSTFNKEFLQLFKDNLEGAFKREFPSAFDWYYENGTQGWYRALENTCLVYNRQDILAYYDSLDWMQSDDFDAELTEIAIEYLNLEKLKDEDLEYGEDNE